MNEFIALITTFPAIVPTFLLCVVVLYWMLVLIGAMDLDFFDLNLDVGGDFDGNFDSDFDLDVEGGGEGLSGFLVNWGLSGVPVSIVFSMLISTVWLLTVIATALLLPLVSSLLPFAPVRWLVGLVILVVLLALAIPITAQMIRPMRGMFRAHQAVNKHTLIGSRCEVKTLSVRQDFGQGELTDGEAGLLLDIVADEPNDIRKGDHVILLSYDNARDCYWVGKA